MKKFETVLFDLDGTLIDSGPGITASVRHALTYYGIENPDPKTLKKFVGPPLAAAFRTYYGLSEQQSYDAIQHYREYYVPTGIWENNLYDGVADLLSGLKTAGYTLGVASSKPQVFVRKILEKHGLSDLFAYIGGAPLDETTNTTKAQTAAEVLKELGKTPGRRILLVGDTKYDVLGAHEIGLSAAGVTYGYGTREELVAASAELLFDTPEELKRYLTE